MQNADFNCLGWNGFLRKKLCCFLGKAEIRRGAVNFKTSDNFLSYFASITIITTIFVIFQGVSAKCRFKDTNEN